MLSELRNKKNNLPTLKVFSKSMNPILYEGDRIKIIKAQLEEINVGDIVVFRALDEEALVCHRIIAKYKYKNRCFFLQGGEVHTSGNFLSEERILGKVIGYYPSGKKQYIQIKDQKEWIKKNKIFIIFQNLFLILYCHYKEIFKMDFRIEIIYRKLCAILFRAKLNRAKRIKY